MAEMYSDFSFPVAFGYWFDALFAGSLLLGIAEIIKLLNIIKNMK